MITMMNRDFQAGQNASPALAFQSDPLLILRETNIFRKCEMLTQHLRVHGPKELQPYFAHILDNLFELNLCAVNERFAPGEYSALVNILSPQGPVFQLVQTLTNQIATGYTLLPLNKLPGGLVEQLVHANASHFILHKLSLDGHSLQLNPLEYFLFLFIGHLVEPRVAEVRMDINSWPTVAYFTLFDRFLAHFLDVDEQQSVAAFNSSILMNLGSRFHPCGRPVGQGHRCLLKKDALIALPDVTGGATSGGDDGAGSGGGNTNRNKSGSSKNASNIFNNNNNISNRKGGSPNFNNSSMSSGGGGGNCTLSSFLLAPNNKAVTLVNVISELWFASPMPGENQQLQRALCVLFKKLHARGFFETSTSAVLRRRLYKYMRLTLTTWPLDSSFRLPLEVWLSFIQPWRYASGELGSGLLGEVASPDRYRVFFDQNFLFYTQLLAVVLERISVLDFGIPSNAVLINRVSKVFSQDRLMDTILGRETRIDLLQQSIADLESPGYAFQAVQSNIWRAKARDLIRSLRHCQRRVEIRTEMLQRSIAEKSWWSKFWETLQGITLPNPTSDARMHEMLRSSIDKLARIFRIDVADIDFLGDEHEMHDASSMSDSSTMTSGVSGRGRRRFDERYAGVPEKQPAMAGEFERLLPCLERWSTALNVRYGRRVADLYRRRATSWLAYVLTLALHPILLPPATYVEIVKEREFSSERRHVEMRLPARIYLRPLARFAVLWLLVGSLVAVRLLGIPLFVGFLLVAVLGRVVAEKLYVALHPPHPDDHGF